MKISRLSLLGFSLALTAGSVYAGECSQRADAPGNPDAAASVPAPAHVFYYNPWADLMRMQAMMDSQFNALNALPIMFVPAPAYAPAVQASTLQRTPEGYRLDIPLSGFKSEDIKVRLDGQLLTVSAQASSSGTVKVGQRDEQSSSSFVETLTLPGPVLAQELKQSFKDGVLTLTLPAQKNPPGSV